MAHEDFTTYNEVDPLNHWSETSSRVTFTGLLDSESSYVYKDYGIDYFTSSFTHSIDIELTSASLPNGEETLAWVWGISNNLGAYSDLYMYDGIWINWDIDRIGGYHYNLYLQSDTHSSSNASLSINTEYYLKIIRTASLTTCKIYPSDIDRTNDTNIIDTLILDSSDMGSFRYLYSGCSNGQSVPSDIISGFQENLDLDSGGASTFQQTTLSDSKILVEGNQQNILSDANISLSNQQTVLSDSKILAQGNQETILSNATIAPIFQSILSDAFILASNIKDLFNKINYIASYFKDISNKFLYKLQSIDNVINIVRYFKGEVLDVENDIRYKKLEINDIKNDIRFISDWQRPGNFGFQSIGKTSIRVFINNIEITDVDIDSIVIDKKINTEHVASFILARPYDSAKPNFEEAVLIKYRDYILYKGYVVDINPSDAPDTIQIDCKDEYWKQNRLTTYFFVGYLPTGDTIDTYYSQISDALNAIYGLNFGIGLFVPDTLHCYNTKRADTLKTLLDVCGNYRFYYDISGNVKLWKSGDGDIINLTSQVIGNNLGLYDIISHRITSSVDNLVNQYRVLMGTEGARNSNFTAATVDYQLRATTTRIDWCVPNWNMETEILAQLNKDGSGFNWHSDEDKKKYIDTFRTWQLPYLNSLFESYSDKESPVIYAFNDITGYFTFLDAQTEIDLLGSSSIITEGFTVQYQRPNPDYSDPNLSFSLEVIQPYLPGTVTFHEPLFLVRRKESIFVYDTSYQNGIREILGDVIDIKAPTIAIKLVKEYSYSLSDNQNPLVFLTYTPAEGYKMGTYPQLIKEDLIMSQYTKRDTSGIIGYTSVNVDFDDTNYAMDVANCQLSKVCDIKEKGNINITLDAACYNNINLENRIFSEGITNNPLNIIGISYKMSDFSVTLEVENGRKYNRTVTLPRRIL